MQLGPGCDSQRIILHKICHSLGMWHEQSRPDRNGYVHILENIKPDKLSQFMKRIAYDIDSLGTKYDYASVMHYNEFGFAKNSSIFTIDITNIEEFIRQGRPLVGFEPTLSKPDTVQLNRLYNCPRSGEPGHLKVTIEKAQNLKSPSPQFYAFVEVMAHDNTRANMIMKTGALENNPNPQWDQELDFGSRVSWQYMNVCVLDYDL